MNSILVSSGQSLLDICLQELGDVSAAFELADANGLAITDLLQPGPQLVVPASVLGRPEVVRYFGGRRINTFGDVPIVIAIPPVARPGYFHKQFFNKQYFN